MSNDRCTACGHVNRPGEAACEMCDARLGEPTRAEGPGAFGGDGEPSAAAEPPADPPAPRFRGAGDVISPTLEVYRKSFLLVGALVAVTTLPFALLQFGALQVMVSAPTDAVPPEGFIPSYFAASMTAQALGWLLYIGGNALLSGSLVYAVIELRRTGTAGAGESLRRGLWALPKVFLVTLLYTVVTWLGFLLLIIPGVILSLMYAVAVPVAVAEGRGPLESLRRSAALTDGYKGLIFMTYFLWGVLIFVLNLIVSGSFSYGEGGDLLPALLFGSLVTGMLNSSTSVLTVFIFLGLLGERGETFRTGDFTPGPAAR